MPRTILFLSLNFSLVFSIAQSLSPQELGWDVHKILHEELGELNYYLSSDKSLKPKPLLIYLDGSGPDPLFMETERGLSSSIAFDYQSLSKNYRILLISKPGVAFMGKRIKNEPKVKPIIYTKTLSLEWRVNSADVILRKLIEEERIDPKRVVVVGFSEGAQVGPFLAEKNPAVSHLVLFGGNGLNQFFDPMISARMQAFSGKISEEEAQRQVDSLFQVAEKIYAEPQSTDKKWWGHSYKRWASFTARDPLTVMGDLDIPIYFANGSKDKYSVLSADYIKLEFIRRGKQNLFYKTYPNYDHQFFELIFEKGEFTDAIPRIDQAMKDAMKWLERN
ncbi:MAG: hypothetical protein R8P61_04360 [Bacteroidia bacterium]|nr:hypothetical protein [Bacteroidia bacterium]